MGALAGGQVLRPSLFREPFDAEPSVSTEEWLVPGRSPARRRYVPVSGGGALEKAWTVEFDSPTGYSLVVRDGVVVCLTVAERALRERSIITVRAFSAADGTRQWRRTFPNEFVGGLAAGGDRLCCPTRLDIRVLDPAGSESYKLPDHRWESALNGVSVGGQYLPVGSVLFTVDDRGLDARDLHTGLRHWTSADRDGGELVFAEPVAAVDGSLYCIDGAGFNPTRVSAVDARAGRLLWQSDRYDAMVRSLTAAEDALVLVGGEVNSHGHVVALSRSDGSPRWRHRVDEALHETAVSDGIVVCSTLSNHLIAFDLATGESLWRRHVGGNNGGTVVTDDRLYVHRATGIEVLDLATGERLQSHEIAGFEADCLAYAGGRLFALRGRSLTAFEVGGRA